MPCRLTFIKGVCCLKLSTDSTRNCRLLGLNFAGEVAIKERRASLISLVVKAIEASRGLVPRSCVQDLLGVHIPDMSKIMDKNICMGLRAFQGIGSLP